MMGRRPERDIRGRREHHLGNVTPIDRSPRFRAEPTSLFDREREQLDDVVKVPRISAQRIAQLLVQAAPHLPSRRAVDEAVWLLTGHPSAQPKDGEL